MRSTPKRVMVLGAVALSMCLTATGCNPSSGESDATSLVSEPIELPYNPDPPGDSRLFATLVGDPGLDGGCAYLRQGGVEFGVLWPPGFAAGFDPVRLYDPDGNVVAEEGDQIELTGKWAADPAAYQPHRCSVGSQLWLAGTLLPGG